MSADPRRRGDLAAGVEIAVGGALVALTGESALATLQEAWRRPRSPVAQAVLAVGAMQLLVTGVGTGLVLRGVRRLVTHDAR